MSDVPPLPTPSYGIYTPQPNNIPTQSVKRPTTATNEPSGKRQKTSGGKITKRNKRNKRNKMKRTNKRKRINKKSRLQ
jgi:hypothetical protein